MGGRCAARPVLDEHCTQTFAGHVRQLVLVDEGHLGVLELRLIREDAAERQGGDKQRTGGTEVIVIASAYLPLASRCDKEGKVARHRTYDSIPG